MNRYVQLIYASAALRPWTPAELLRLLHGARARNAHHEITGLLAYNDGTFLQLLEGPPDAVQGVLMRIRADRRHGEVTVLLQREIEDRFFPDWSMGFQDLADVIPGPGLTTFLPQAATPTMWSAQPEAALNFFEHCRAPAGSRQVNDR